MNSHISTRKFTLRSLLRRQDGQLTIFLGIGLTIFLTMMAFIINVGLFVRAKINLQNAVDAAAWSGAAVQARQLSQIAYLNYEIRNVYKEWMFKYYVLGNLGHTKRMRTGASGASLGDFRLKPAGGLNDSSNYDRFNVPSICVHAGNSPNDICLTSFVPGLPRFEAIQLPNITHENQTFIDAISAEKAKDCSARSAINFSTALIWTYGTGGSVTAPGMDTLASERLGAWPASILLGMRVRTMEAIVNRPPVTEPITAQTIDALKNDNFVANERPVKAFWAALRNYSGGVYKDGVDPNSGLMDETLSSFELEELSPRPYEADPSSLSGMLYPSTGSRPWNSNLLIKHYLDLWAVPVNYAIFYTSLTSRANSLQLDGQPIETDAECSTTRTAMPVPAYLTGFQKNPEVLTYYAVRGSVNFRGLFFPFSSLFPNGIKISAVAAAKPFGGRIGPKIFQINPTESSKVYPRDPSTGIGKSMAFLTGLPQINTGGANDVLSPGMPIPNVPEFWVDSASSVIGGVPGNVDPTFAIPNLIYNVNSRSSADGELTPHFTASGGSFPTHQVLTQYSSSSAGKLESAGMYNSAQFKMFADLLGNISGTLTPTDLHNAIKKVRQPSRYDALNYLAPLGKDDPTNNVKGNMNTGEAVSDYMMLYGPLYGPEAIYNNVSHIEEIVHAYIEANRLSVEKFLKGLEIVADEIRNSSTPVSQANSAAIYYAAPNDIYPNGVNASDTTAFENEMQSKFCGGGTGGPSVAARFSYFLRSNVELCGGSLKPLSILIRDYINQRSTEDENFPTYHTDELWNDTPPSDVISGNAEILTAYRPGPEQGADEEGVILNPISGADIPHKRNYYSTKLVSFDYIQNKGEAGVPFGLIERADNNGPNPPPDSKINGGYDNPLAVEINVAW